MSSRVKHGSRPRSSAARQERVFEGLAVSPGVAIGPAHLRESGEVQVLEYRIPARQARAEADRFAKAIEKARRQIGKIRGKARSLHGTAAEELGYLLDAHQQMLSSQRLSSGVIRRVEREQLNVEAATLAEIESLAANFEQMEDPYLRSRAQEVREVGYRILRNLADRPFASFGELPHDSIILAEEITPADTALMDPNHVGGFACAVGGVESHTAIMARSLGLPAVLGCAGFIGRVKPGETVIVDGSHGLVVVAPTRKTLQRYRRQKEEMQAEVSALKRLRKVPAVTLDGVRIALQANLELPREVGQAVMSGAEGVGLLRTEFLFMNRDDLPDEEEQYQALKKIIDAMAGQPVTIRTLDVGGEKLAGSIAERHGPSPNPALGLRAIRLGLKEPRLLETQLAAVLRAAAEGPVRILLPMIASVEELRQVRKLLQRVARRLRRRGVALPDPMPPLGAMIEVPGAALAADALAAEVDFLAIGTNDLTMYTLAIDRGDERVAELYNPLHPAVLRLVQFSIEAARKAGIPVSVCGEVAGDPRYTPLLLGLGVRELSTAAIALPRIKARIRELRLAQAAALASAVMSETESARIGELLDEAPSDPTLPFSLRTG